MGVKAGGGGAAAVGAGAGLREYYEGKIAQLELAVRAKQHDLHRMEAQRNELNSRGGGRRAPQGPGRAGCWGATPLHSHEECQQAEGSIWSATLH